MKKLVFEAGTKGGRYGVQVWQRKDALGTGEQFDAYWATRDSIQSANCGYTRIEMIERLRKELDSAKAIDGINYRILFNELGEPI